MMYKLKPLSKEAVPAALEKAHRYRLLNEPVEAESICRDILEIDPDNQDALVTLFLALTDQLGDHLGSTLQQAQDVLSRIRDEYSRTYRHGILCERRAKAQLKRGGPRSGNDAYEWFQEAMQHYEKAAEMRPKNNDEAILRWNACARILMANPHLVAEPEEAFQPWLE
jgi:tetratricopeptide (TPR) repeat protein